MTLRTIAIIGAVLLLIAACDRSRLQGKHVTEGRAFAHVEHALDEVDASDEQTARVRTILSKALTDLEPWPATMDRLRTDLTTAWRSDTPDREALHQRVEHEIESLRALSHALIDDGLALHGVLTSEQRRDLLRFARSRKPASLYACEPRLPRRLRRPRHPGRAYHRALHISRPPRRETKFRGDTKFDPADDRPYSSPL